jgi:hypothetical protein
MSNCNFKNFPGHTPGSPLTGKGKRRKEKLREEWGKGRVGGEGVGREGGEGMG